MPETPLQRAVYTGSDMAADAVGGGAAARMASSFIPALGIAPAPLTSTTGNVIREMAQAPGVAAATGAAAGAGSSLAQELTDDQHPILKNILGQLGGLAGGVAVGGPAMVLTKGKSTTPEMAPTITGIPTSDDHGTLASAHYADASKNGATYGKQQAYDLIDQFEQHIHDTGASLKTPEPIKAFLSGARADIDKTPGSVITATTLDGLRAKLGELSQGADGLTKSMAGDFRGMIEDKLKNADASIEGQRAAMSDARAKLAAAKQENDAAQADANFKALPRGADRPSTVEVDPANFKLRGAMAGASPIKVMVNPDDAAIAKLTGDGAVRARVVKDDKGNIYVWRADEPGMHYDVARELGIDYSTKAAADDAKARGISADDYGMIRVDPATGAVSHEGVPTQPDLAKTKTAVEAEDKLAAAQKAHNDMFNSWSETDPAMKKAKTAQLVANAKAEAANGAWAKAKSANTDALQNRDALQSRIDSYAGRAVPNGLKQQLADALDTVGDTNAAVIDAKRAADRASAAVPKVENDFAAAFDHLAPADPAARAAVQARIDAQNQSLANGRQSTINKYNAKALEDLAANVEAAKNAPHYSGDEAGVIRNEVQKLVNDPQFNNFPPQAQAAFRDMLKRNNIAALARLIGYFTPGSKYGGFGSAVDVALGVAAARNPLALAGAAVAPTAKAASNYFAKQKLAAAANKVDRARAAGAPQPSRMAPVILRSVGQPAVSQPPRKRNYFAQ
jgi:hypothetical protein